ncbi:hypothetical protein HMPREF1548_01458 [Clostridium sp. KLE 1755]|nr:hypothetical protein HMPREF1548_01458 [Clostridium sp. KLE 1755]
MHKTLLFYRRRFHSIPPICLLLSFFEYRYLFHVLIVSTVPLKTNPNVFISNRKI